MSVVDECNRAYVGVEKDGQKQRNTSAVSDRFNGRKVSCVFHHMIPIIYPVVRTVYSAAFFRHTIYSATAPFRGEANPFPVSLSLPLPLPLPVSAWTAVVRAILFILAAAAKPDRQLIA